MRGDVMKADSIHGLRSQDKKSKTSISLIESNQYQKSSIKEVLPKLPESLNINPTNSVISRGKTNLPESLSMNALENVPENVPVNLPENVPENLPTNLPVNLPVNLPTNLPVLDFRFNVREIIKEIVLLEQHLVHPGKYCSDCVKKHFLTVEALSEEMLTLHTNVNSLDRDLYQLPSKIRELQYSWWSNPEQNRFLVSRQLRSLRKQYMEDYFGIIFEEGIQKKSCSSCQIK